jgi:Domain of unknown function (DUF4136)
MNTKIVQRRSPRKALTMVAVGCAFLTLAVSAFAVTAKTDYDHSVNFEKYGTFAWKNYGMRSNGIINNSIVASRIQYAVNEQLTKKGLREDDRNPDVYVVAHIGAKNMADFEYMPGVGGWRHWRWMGPDVFVNRYVQGTTIIDLVDAKTNELVWRAIATDEGSNVLDVQSPKKIEKMAADAFKHFPPKA